jgi:hypothetical protein
MGYTYKWMHVWVGSTCLGDWACCHIRREGDQHSHSHSFIYSFTFILSILCLPHGKVQGCFTRVHGRADGQRSAGQTPPRRTFAWAPTGARCWGRWAVPCCCTRARGTPPSHHLLRRATLSNRRSSSCSCEERTKRQHGARREGRLFGVVVDVAAAAAAAAGQLAAAVWSRWQRRRRWPVGLG